MSWLSRLERRLAPFAIPNLTQILIAGQVVLFFVGFIQPELVDAIRLIPRAFAQGEWWRVFAFPFIPSFSLIFFVFEVLFLWTIGTALESTWGTLRYNVFFFIGCFSAIAAAALCGIVAPDHVIATNEFLYTSMFLAFAYLYPEFEILLMFILPVKVKYLAAFTLVVYLLTFFGGLATFAAGGWLMSVMVVASNLNLLVFFGREFVQRFRSRSARIKMRFEEVRAAGVPRHTCAVCGATNLSHPDRDFRYCTECEGTPAYCNEHLAGHKHRSTAVS